MDYMKERKLQPMSPPPPIPDRSSKRINRKPAKLPRPQKQSHSPMKTYRYSSGFTNAPEAFPTENSSTSSLSFIDSPGTSPTHTSNVENLLSDAFARPLHQREPSGTTATSGLNSIFENASAQSPETPNTPLTSAEQRLALDQAHQPPMGPRSECFQYLVAPEPEEDHERFPFLSNPFKGKKAAQSNSSPEKVQNLGQKLVGKLKGAIEYLHHLDDELEEWTWQNYRKRFEKKKQAEARRASLERAKAIDHGHRALIKTHQEKEKARNKRAKVQLKAQNKELRESAKRRNKAAKGNARDTEVVEQEDQRISEDRQRLIGGRLAENNQYTETQVTEHEIVGTSSDDNFSESEGESFGDWDEDYTFIQGAEEYDPKHCGRAVGD
ncbi:uncharacterized protein LY89DRAFT_712834 [Mollisia scopiformis]|uniref:Uncharacterized protein n=1 Tax=Mollisia scopiformis TaxID=149040 RepID=A0A194XUP1_MOLSC|nr:uncharacterized protein LY89DRAFT_712834 [Mollisia scopiformis]KUJ23856.1 hypothetical protein LY89DRAFT_712834 [Mollisia scopiformis]